MGGFGSGRRGWHASIEATDSYVLNARVLRGIRPGATGSGILTWGDGFEVSVTVETINDDVRLILEHEHRSSREAEAKFRYCVDLTETRPHFGGRRWWFRCPRSGRRVGRLYLPLGGFQFWGRRAYALAYQCQRESYLDRMMRKARKLHRRIGGDGDDYSLPPRKPMRMRRRTYEQLMARWEEAAEQADHIWTQEVFRRYGRYLR